MTPRERLAAAMEGRPHDRVPFMCQMSIGHMLLQLPVSPVEVWNDIHVFAEGLVELRARYGFDGILVSLHGHDPAWRSFILRREPSPEGETIEWRDGSRTLYRRDDLPEHHPAVERAEARSKIVPRPLSYIPVSQGLHFAIHPIHRFDILRTVRSLAGNDVAIHGEVTSPFDYLLDVLGIEQALMALLDDPSHMESLLETFADGVSEIAAAMCREDIDAVKISSPFAGAGFLSRSHYEQFVLPYERRVVEAIQSFGKPAYLHTCGAIGDRLDLMALSGARGLECLDPPPMGTVELAEALTVLEGKMFVKGNIDSVNSLLLGTSDAAVNDARERLRLGKRYGRFILSTA
ncbi:MAG: uroporphyrinogen decarboxylase family protein, partial [Bacteroidota bacterium]